MPQKKERAGVKAKGASKGSKQQKGAKKGYLRWSGQVEKRGSCKVVETADGKKIKARAYRMRPEKLAEALDVWMATGRFPSPYTKGIQTHFLLALSSLGINREWSYPEVKSQMKKMMSTPELTDASGKTAWERFEGKPRRTSNGKPVFGRLMAMAKSFRKTIGSGSSFPVAARLEQMGCCLDIFYVGPVKNEAISEVFLRLNQFSTEPLNMLLESRSQIPDVDRTSKTLGPVT